MWLPDKRRPKTWIPALVVMASFCNHVRRVGAAGDGGVSSTHHHAVRVVDTTPASSFGLLAEGISRDAKWVNVKGEGSGSTIGLTPKLTKRSIPHFKASVLTLAIFSIPLWRHWSGLDLVVFTVALYLLEVLTCSTRRYLSNGLTPAGFRQMINALISTKPEIVWDLECYHYRNEHLGRNSSRDKVVTYRARREFDIESWNDVTDKSSIDRYLEQHSCAFVKISITKLILFSDEQVRERYTRQETSFRSSWHDIHNDFRTQIHVPGFRSKLLVVSTGLSDVPLARTIWFWVFSLMGLTVPYRVWFSKQCAEGEVTLTKTISS